jgi:hypothetical protein
MQRTESTRKTGKRVAELQKKYTGEAPAVNMNASESSESSSFSPPPPMTRTATAKKIYEHEVKVWLEANVETSRDF